MDNVERISYELAKVEEGKLKAYADKDRVILMIQDAPAELRRLADALERIKVREIQALIAYRPAHADADNKAGTRPKPEATKLRKER